MMYILWLPKIPWGRSISSQSSWRHNEAYQDNVTQDYINNICNNSICRQRKDIKRTRTVTVLTCNNTVKNKIKLEQPNLSDKVWGVKFGSINHYTALPAQHTTSQCTHPHTSGFPLICNPLLYPSTVLLFVANSYYSIILVIPHSVEARGYQASSRISKILQS